VPAKQRGDLCAARPVTSRGQGSGGCANLTITRKLNSDFKEQRKYPAGAGKLSNDSVLRRGTPLLQLTVVLYSIYNAVQ
jgi:hypothetical protein